MPKLNAVVGLDLAEEELPKYEPLLVDVAATSTETGQPVIRTFEFLPEVNFGEALEFNRVRKSIGGTSYEAAYEYIELSMTKANFAEFVAWIRDPEIVIRKEAFVELQQQLAAEYFKNRPTLARSSNGRAAKPKGTSAAKSGSRAASTSGRSRSTSG